MKIKRGNNKGSTIIIVLLMCSFIMIIATAITITTMTCLQLRIVQAESKKTFYTSEQAVDEVYAAIGAISINCFNDVYTEQLKNIRTSVTYVAGNPISNTYINNDEANYKLRQKYTMTLLEKLGVKGTATQLTTKDVSTNKDVLSSGLLKYNAEGKVDTSVFVTACNGYIDGSLGSDEAGNKKVQKIENLKVKSVENIKVILEKNPKETGGTGYDTYFFEFEDLVVEYKTSAGYYSDVTFNGKVGLPDVLIDFVDNDVTGTLNFASYSLIGNVGVDIKSASSAVAGSVFAGKARGLNLLADTSLTGRRIITAGDINIGATTSIANSMVYALGVKIGHKAGYMFDNTKIGGVGDDYTYVQEDDTAKVTTAVAYTKETNASGAETGRIIKTLTKTTLNKSTSETTISQDITYYNASEYANATSGVLTASNSSFNINDDLEVNGNDSSATFNGSTYSGYGYEYATVNAVGGQISNRVGKPDGSSCIVINSSGSSISFNASSSVLISGRAFVTYYNVISKAGQKKDGNYTPLATGEEYSLDVNQEIYMVPAKLIKTGTNPYYSATSTTSVNDNNFELNAITQQNFFGASLLVSGTDASGNAVKQYEYRNAEIDTTDASGNVTTKYYTYYYLKFKNLASMKKYVQIISSADEYASYIQSLKAQNAAYAGLNEVATNDPTWVALHRLYVNNNNSITIPSNVYSSYLTSLLSSPAGTTNVAAYDKEYQDKASRYKALYTLLMDLDSTDASGSYKYYTAAKVEEEITDYEDYCKEYDANGIFGNFINKTALNELNSGTNGVGGTYSTTALNDPNFYLIGTTGDYTVPSTITDGVIVCDGNVTLNHSFNGVIIANKVITVGGSGVTVQNTYTMDQIVEYIQSASVLKNGTFYYYKKIFKYWNSKEKNSSVGAMTLAEMTYKDMVSFSEWRKYED